MSFQVFQNSINTQFVRGSTLSAYGYATGAGATTLVLDAPVVFTIASSTYPNAGFTAIPAALGTSFIVATTGFYQFDFTVIGSNPTGATVPLSFALFRTGVLIAGTGFRSNLGAAAADIKSCIGHGIVSLTAGDVITLRNKTGETVTFAAGVVPTDNNRALSLVLIA